MRKQFNTMIRCLVGPVAILGYPFEPEPLRPRLAATLSALCPGLGFWYIGQGGVFIFYLSWVCVCGVGAYDLLRRWRPESVFSAHFLTWGLFAIVTGAVVWLISILDVWLRTRRLLVRPRQAVPPHPITAAFLSLLIPGLGQWYSRRFLSGLWYFLLIMALAMSAWDILPQREAAYYLPFTNDPRSWNHAFYVEAGWAFIKAAAVLWIANILEAGYYAGQPDVLPDSITRFITPGRIREAWPELVYAAGFLAIEYQALDSWWPEPLQLIEYSKYWLLYESLTVVGVLLAVSIFQRRTLSKDLRAAITGLLAVAAWISLVLFRTDYFDPRWLAATFAIVMIPRIIHVAINQPDTGPLLEKIRLAGKCLTASLLALGLIFLFWRIINPWFYNHLVKTRGLYTLGLCFYSFMGWMELRQTIRSNTRIPENH